MSKRSTSTSNVMSVSSFGDAGESTYHASEMTEVSRLLRSHPLFSSMSDSDIDMLIRDATIDDVEQKTRLISENTPVNHLFVILDGIVRIFHCNSQGRQVTVKHLTPPSTFGEVEILACENLLKSAEMLTPGRVVQIPAASFLQLIGRDHATARRLLRNICERFCMTARNERAVFHEVEARLASLLIAYAELFGKTFPSGLRLNLKITQDDLANGLGVATRSVSRTLTGWKKNGWISIRKGWYVVHDMPALEDLTQGLRSNLNYNAN